MQSYVAQEEEEEGMEGGEQRSVGVWNGQCNGNRPERISTNLYTMQEKLGANALELFTIFYSIHAAGS